MAKPLNTTEQVQQLLSQDQANLALPIIKQALNQNPNNPNLHFQLAYVQERLGRIPDAIEGYRALTQTFPELSEPHNNLGVLLAQTGDLDQAQRHFTLALNVNPNNAMALENLSDVMLRLALANYHQLLKQFPNNPGLATKSQALSVLVRQFQP